MAQPIPKDSTATAIGYLMVGVAGGLGLDLCAKALLETFPLPQFVLVRSAIGVAIFFALVRRFGGLESLITMKWRWHLLRTLLATGAMFGFFYGLARMPLVNALTLGFTAPLMVTALSVPLLGDHVGWRRWTAVSIGFVGVLIILRPGRSDITLADVAVLFAALCYAVLAITARKLSTTENSFSLSVYVTAGPMVLSAFMVSSGSWVAPDLANWLLFTLAGACSVIAWIGIVGGYRRAPPAMLAPFEYTALVGGAIAGYLIWDEVPDRWVIIGATVIIGSGLFVVYREISGQLSTRYSRALSAAGAATLFRRLRRKSGATDSES